MTPVVKLLKIASNGIILFPSAEGIKHLSKNKMLQPITETIAGKEVSAFLLPTPAPIKFVKTEHYFMQNRVVFYIWTIADRSVSIALPLHDN